LAAFYLPTPPKEDLALHDFRRFPDSNVTFRSPKLLLAIRQARFRKEIAQELYSSIEGPPPLFPLNLDIHDDPEEIGVAIRNVLRISYEEQTSWHSANQAFSRWRSALEETEILVFQTSGIDLDEMRAFSLSEIPLPVVVLNIRDTYTGRVFSMLHEIVHIGLQKGGICDIREDSGQIEADRKIEIFCNQIAGAALVPKDLLLAEKTVICNRSRNDWSDEDIQYLANRYSVSREVLLRRLLIHHRITRSFYEQKQSEYEMEFRSHVPEQKKKIRIPTHRKVLASVGYSFARLVLSNYYQERITPGDVSEFLDMRLKHLPKIEQEIFGAGPRSGVSD